MGSILVVYLRNSKSNTVSVDKANMAHADTVKKIMAIKESNPGNIAIASFDEAAFNGMSEADQARILKIMASGIGNPGSEMGCYAMGPTDYDDFYDFFKKALGRYHKVNLDEKKHSNDWELKGKEGLPADGVLDVSAFGIKEPLSMRIRTARNLKKSLKINDVFDRLKAAIDKVEDLIPGGCAKSKDFGVITSCPTNMGTGMRASVHIKIPNLTKGGSDGKAVAILKPYGLGVRGLGGEHTPIGADGTVDISPKARFCISEAEIAIALYKGVEKVMQEESKA